MTERARSQEGARAVIERERERPLRERETHLLLLFGMR
jgi:hypothetical protein